MKKNAEPVHLAGSVLSLSRHVCAFFHSQHVGGILQENSFFVPPDVMLKELRERGAAPTCD